MFALQTKRRRDSFIAGDRKGRPYIVLIKPAIPTVGADIIRLFRKTAAPTVGNVVPDVPQQRTRRYCTPCNV